MFACLFAYVLDPVLSTTVCVYRLRMQDVYIQYVFHMCSQGNMPVLMIRSYN